LRFLAALALIACERAQTPPPEITVSPTPSATTATATASATATVSATASASASVEPEPFGALWLSCRKDDDCTFVSLGCCHGRAIAKKYQADGQRVLDESKLERCPLKTGCAVSPVVCSHAICKFK
jgi:hypothetical protein